MDARSLPFHAKRASACWLPRERLALSRLTKKREVCVKSSFLLANCAARYKIKKAVYLRDRWYTIELSYNDVHRGGSCAFFPIDDRLRIAIGTIINAIRNISGLNVECRMSTSCNSVIDCRNSAIAAALFDLERNHSTTVKTM